MAEPLDLDAIRARDARDFSPASDWLPIVADRHALLAEVDRLAAELAETRQRQEVWLANAYNAGYRAALACEGTVCQPSSDPFWGICSVCGEPLDNGRNHERCAP